MTTVAQLLVRLDGDSSGLVASMASAERAMGSFQSKAAAGFARISKIARTAVIGLGVASAAIVGMSINMAAGFDKGMREVNTLINLNQTQFNDLRDDTLELSKEIGITTTEVVPALYQAISASVPRENVMEFLAVAGRASIGGVTDLKTAVDGLTSVTNAYGSETISAAQAADLMFTAVRLGKTTFEELSGSLFNVVPVASAVGVSFDTVTAAIAAMTAQGVPTSVASTQLRNAMLALTAPSVRVQKVVKELGLDFSVAALKEKGLADTTKELVDRFGDDLTMLRRVLGSQEALNAVLILGGKGAQTFADDLDEMARSVGAADKAFEEMEMSTSRLWERVKAQLRVALIELGEDLLPVVNRLLIQFSDWVSQNGDEIARKFESIAEIISRVADALAQVSLSSAIEVTFTLPPLLLAAGAAAAALSGNFVLAGFLMSAAGGAALAQSGSFGGSLENQRQRLFEGPEGTLEQLRSDREGLELTLQNLVDAQRFEFQRMVARAGGDIGVADSPEMKVIRERIALIESALGDITRLQAEKIQLDLEEEFAAPRGLDLDQVFPELPGGGGPPGLDLPEAKTPLELAREAFARRRRQEEAEAFFRGGEKALAKLRSDNALLDAEFIKTVDAAARMGFAISEIYRQQFVDVQREVEDGANRIEGLLAFIVARNVNRNQTGQELVEFTPGAIAEAQNRFPAAGNDGTLGDTFNIDNVTVVAAPDGSIDVDSAVVVTGEGARRAARNFGLSEEAL